MWFYTYSLFGCDLADGRSARSFPGKLGPRCSLWRGCGMLRGIWGPDSKCWGDAFSRRVKSPFCPRIPLSCKSIILLQSVLMSKAGLRWEARKPRVLQKLIALVASCKEHRVAALKFAGERERGRDVLVSLDGSNYLMSPTRGSSLTSQEKMEETGCPLRSVES